MSESSIRSPEPSDRDDETATAWGGVDLEQQRGFVVGRVVAVSDHPGARAPSWLLRIDVGTGGEIEAQMEPGSYAKDELLHRLVIVTTGDGAIVLAARSHAHGPVLVRPDMDVEVGTPVA